MTDAARKRIAAAFAALNLAEDKQEAVKGYVSILSQIAGRKPEVAPKRYRLATSVGYDRERKELAHAARTLAKAIDCLHGPTLSAIANAIPLAIAGVRVVEVDPENRIIVETLKVKIDISSVQLKWPDQLRALADAASKADLRGAPEKTGAPVAGRIAFVRTYLADAYFSLTGDEPKAGKKSDFTILVKQVAEAMELDAQPGGMAKIAADQFKLKKNTSKSG